MLVQALSERVDWAKAAKKTKNVAATAVGEVAENPEAAAANVRNVRIIRCVQLAEVPSDLAWMVWVSSLSSKKKEDILFDFAALLEHVYRKHSKAVCRLIDHDMRCQVIVPHTRN